MAEEIAVYQDENIHVARFDLPGGADIGSQLFDFVV